MSCFLVYNSKEDAKAKNSNGEVYSTREIIFLIAAGTDKFFTYVVNDVEGASVVSVDDAFIRLKGDDNEENNLENLPSFNFKDII